MNSQILSFTLLFYAVKTNLSRVSFILFGNLFLNSGFGLQNQVDQTVFDQNDLDKLHAVGVLAQLGIGHHGGDNRVLDRKSVV